MSEQADPGEVSVQRARARAESLRGQAAGNREQLRVEAARLFEALPEPPEYSRAEDPARDRAKALLPDAEHLLAQLLALEPASSSPPGDAGAAATASQARQLVAAVEACTRALAAIAAGDIGRGDDLARLARRAISATTGSGAMFRSSADSGVAKVFDRETGRSRYDPRDEPMLTLQLYCGNEGCRQPATYGGSPSHATLRFTCSHCRRAFTGHFIEVRHVEAQPLGGAMRYRLRGELAGGGPTSIEFTDASGASLAVAPRDRIALLYSATGALTGVENLTTGYILWLAKKAACFIATAALGPEAPELETFRALRDRVLLPTRPGRAFVRLYYRCGPSLAAALERHPHARALVRLALKALHRSLATH